MKARIVWNGRGGELDSVVIKYKDDDDHALTKALIELIRGNIVTAGDTFEIIELAV